MVKGQALGWAQCTAGGRLFACPRDKSYAEVREDRETSQPGVPVR